MKNIKCATGEKKPENSAKSATVRKSFRLIVAFCLCLFCSTALFAQTGSTYDFKVDSLTQVYINMGIDPDMAKQRATTVIDAYYQSLIMPLAGTWNGSPAQGSIAVNRSTKYRAFSPTQLVDSVFVKEGAYSGISNVKLITHGWNDTIQSWRNDGSENPANSIYRGRGLGYFSNGTSNFDFAEGIVLSTGGLVSIEGPNSTSNGVAAPGTPYKQGDPDLSKLITNQSVTNYTALEFDFVPAASVISFRYVFASEEYLNYVQQFNDVFGFFIWEVNAQGDSVPGTKTNIARLPSTTSGDYVVSINNVNWGNVPYANHNCAIPDVGTQLKQPTGSEPANKYYPVNKDYYKNIPANSPSTSFGGVSCGNNDVALSQSMEFNGRTVMLTAMATVIPCHKYHLKMAIGNAGDTQLQSGVFLEAGSFDVGNNSENYGNMTRGQRFVFRGCDNNMFAVFRPNGIPNTQSTTVYLNYGGTALNNITASGGLPSSVVIPAGVDSVFVPYSVGTLGSGLETFEITGSTLQTCGGVTMVVDIYDPSDPINFKAMVGQYACAGNNGTSIVATGTGGNGKYESSIDGGATWQLSTGAGYTYSSLAPGVYTVLIRDQGSCFTYSRTVSTYCYGFKVNDIDFTNQGYVHCNAAATNLTPVTLKAYTHGDALNGNNITWKFSNGATLGTGTGTTQNLSLPDGYYEVQMTYAGVTYTTNFWVGGKPKIWTPERNTAVGAVKTSWADDNNWTPYGMPTACDDVYIPGKNTNYPNLSGAAACRKIYFMQGSELGHPNLLSYKRAYVQMNCGLRQTAQNRGASLVSDSNLLIKSNLFDRTAIAGRLKYIASVSDTLSREDWHILSSPLRDAVSGDLSFGGYPLTFMKKFLFNTSAAPYNTGDWSVPYNALIEPLSGQPTDGYAFYMYGYGNPYSNLGCLEDGIFSVRDRSIMGISDSDPMRGLNQRFGLRNTNGILELPFFEEDIELAQHRTQLYDTLSRKSRFYYTYDGTNAPDFNELSGNYEERTRNANAGEYRFIAETPNGTGWNVGQTVTHTLSNVKAGEDFLVGNPFMSALDMAAFLTANSSRVQDHYRIWDWAEHTFITYKYNGAGGFTATKESDGTTPATLNAGYVAPLQGFFLTTAVDINGLNQPAATFDANLISTIRPANTASNLRSAPAEENVIRIKAENDWAASYMYVGYDANATDGFKRGTDVQRLFSSGNNNDNDYTPEIYALTGDNIPTDIRFISDSKTPLIVPLGIKMNYDCKIRITVSGMNNYQKAKKIEFVDAKGQTTDLTGMSSFTCTFDNTGEGAIINGRFSLRISQTTTLLPAFSAEDLKIYGNSTGFYVITPTSDRVQQVMVYDFQGRLLFESETGASYYPMAHGIGERPYIVKAITKNNVRVVKIQ